MWYKNHFKTNQKHVNMLNLIHKRWEKQEKQEETIARVTTNVGEQTKANQIAKKNIIQSLTKK